MIRFAVAMAASAAVASAQGAVGPTRRTGLAYQLTYSQNYDPTFSPDGRRMIYISRILGREQLFAVNLDGTDPVQLTADSVDHEDPAWSPDGTKVVFVSIAHGQEVISLMNIDGSNRQAMTDTSLRAIHPFWSPDGKKLAYCTDDDLHPPAKNPADIYVLDLATKRSVKVITGGVNTYPAWSPDGGKIAFRRMLGEMNSEVFVANSDGTGATNLTNHPAFDGWPAWSPDGREIAFASNRNANYQIFVMHADGSGVRLVANTEGRATAPVWSRDGATIYFTNCQKRDYGTSCEIFGVATPSTK